MAAESHRWDWFSPVVGGKPGGPPKYLSSWIVAQRDLILATGQFCGLPGASALELVDDSGDVYPSEGAIVARFPRILPWWADGFSAFPRHEI